MGGGGCLHSSSLTAIYQQSKKPCLAWLLLSTPYSTLICCIYLVIRSHPIDQFKETNSHHPNTMDTFLPSPTIIFSLTLALIVCLRVTNGSTFTFVNKCGNTVWPGILSGAGSTPLDATGFELETGSSRSFQAPTGWSGRFWARTGCAFDSSGRGSCATGDCGSGEMECRGAGAAPPATLAEFTLAGPSSGKDFYDVSLVDGYNLPMLVESSGTGCAATGCITDLNRQCPAELRVGEGEACRSACEAFGKPEFCCSGAYASPSTCRPSVYSQVFKNACPRSYSYAYDDSTSTFTCPGPADYTITFCPDSSPSRKSAEPRPKAAATTTAGEEVLLENDSWLASLATGTAARRDTLLAVGSTIVGASIACVVLLLL